MLKCSSVVVAFIAVTALLVNQFQSVSCATIAPTTTDENTLTHKNNAHDATNSSPSTEAVNANRIDVSYFNDSFKEIAPNSLQFIGDDNSAVELFCHLTNNRTTFVRLGFHGIEERKFKIRKSLEDENGLLIDLSSGPPVLRMACSSYDRTVSNYTLIYTGENKSPYLYKNGETIRAALLDQTTAHLPCLLKYPLDNNSEGKELQLFKDGKQIPSEHYSYAPELGYNLNLAGLENPLGTYECRVKNSPNDSTFVKLDNDAFIEVSYTGYDNKFYAGAPKLQPFECKLPKCKFENDFKWSYLRSNGNYTALNVSSVSNVSDSVYYGETVKATFYSVEITGVVCSGILKNSGTPYNNSYEVFVKKAYPPVILNQPSKKPIIYEQGLNLTCVTAAEPLTFRWQKNGQPIKDANIKEYHVHPPFRSSLILKPAADDKDDNYTCIVENFFGNATRDFRVQLLDPTPASKSFNAQYLIIAAVILAIAVILLGLFLTFYRIKVTRRPFDPRLSEWFFGGTKKEEIPYNELEPYASVSYDFSREIKYDKLNFELKGGQFGKVHFGWLHDKDAGTAIPVAIKQIKDDSTASEEEIKHEFTSFLNEIKIMQEIKSHKHVVSYIGAVTSDIKRYSAHLVVEYCSEGDLASYLQKIRLSGLFHDDIQSLHHISGNQSHNGQVVLKTSHLMKWAEDIADGMHYIYTKRLVHRDLAARNVLLGYQGINSDEYANVDPGKLIAKISDFGLSKDLCELDKNYYQIVFDRTNPENNRQRKLPLRWLSLEALRSLRFTTKSDVWALGVTYWEMFTLGNNGVPYADEVRDELGDMRTQLIEYIESGGLPSEPELAPREMWEIMLQCWQENPEDRPPFSLIRDTLKALNESRLNPNTMDNNAGGGGDNHVQPYEPVQAAPARPHYSTLGIVADMGYNNMAYNDQLNETSDTESNEEDEAEGSNGGAYVSVNAVQSYGSPTATAYQNSTAPYATVGYVENLGYDNMEMGQYYNRGSSVTTEDKEEEEGKVSSSNDNENDKSINNRLTDQISASG